MSFAVSYDEVVYLCVWAALGSWYHFPALRVTWHWVSFIQHSSTFHPAVGLLIRSILQNLNEFPDRERWWQTKLPKWDTDRASLSMNTDHGAGNLQLPQRHIQKVTASFLAWPPSQMKWHMLVNTWEQRSTSPKEFSTRPFSSTGSLLSSGF